MKDEGKGEGQKQKKKRHPKGGLKHVLYREDKKQNPSTFNSLKIIRKHNIRNDFNLQLNFKKKIRLLVKSRVKIKYKIIILFKELKFYCKQ